MRRDQPNLEKRLRERNKELNCLHTITKISEDHRDSNLKILLQEIVNILPQSWQYPEITGARIRYNDIDYSTEDYKSSTWCQKANIPLTRKSGFVEVSYFERRKSELEGPFLREERNLINTIAERLGSLIKNKEADEKLVESEAKFRAFFEKSVDAMAIVTVDGTILEINQAGCDIFGYTKEEIMKIKTLDLYYDPNIRHKFQQELEETGKYQNEDIIYVRKDGKIINTLCSTTNVYDSNRTVIVYYSIIRDVTEQKYAEEQLKESERMFRNAIVDSPLPVMLHAEDGEVIVISKVWTELTGYTIEDIPTIEDWTERVYGDRKDKINKIIANQFNSLQGENIGEFTITCKDKSQLIWDFNSSPLGKLPDGRKLLKKVAVDITERKKTEAEVIIAKEELRVSEERFRTLAETSQVGIYQTDIEGKCLYVNKQWSKFSGLNFDDALGTDWVNALHPEDKDFIFSKWNQFVKYGKKFAHEYRFVTSEGKVTWILGEATTISNDNNEIVGYMGTVTDLTEQKEAEAERIKFEAKILQSQKLDSLGLLAGGIAHDFNNYLMGIIGNSSLALHEISPSAQYRDLIEEIEMIATKATSLTNQMLAYAGKGKYDISVIDLSTLVQSMFPLLRVSIENAVDLVLKLSNEVIPVEVDKRQFEQLLVNLVINSSEAIKKHGKITIGTGKTKIDSEYLTKHIHFGELIEGEYSYISVEDDGIGIKIEDFEKIFDPFYSTKFTGRGLGLSVVYAVVKGHKAAIEVKSNENNGTTMKVYFHISPKPIDKSNNETKKTEVNFHSTSQTILIVDDEDEVRKIAKRMLEKLNYQTLVASNGREAVDIVKTNPDIDLVLMDLTMPELGGGEAMIEIKKINEDIPVILSSGYSEEELSKMESKQKIAGFIQKPYKFQQLAEILQNTLALNIVNSHYLVKDKNE